MPTIPCPCCCGGGKKACYQEWYTFWTCATETWATSAPDNNVCLRPSEALTSWTKAGENSSNCRYKRHVPIGGCCTASDGCAARPDATPPAPPTGKPGDCCCCADAKKCVFTFAVTYDCDAEEFGDVTSKGRKCKTGDTIRTEWTSTGGDESHCEWEIDVPCGGPCNCCTTDANCASCPEPDPPAPPGDPGTCCACPCTDDLTLACCGYPGDTPESFTAAMDVHASDNPLDYNYSSVPTPSGPNAGKYFVAKLSGSVGSVTFTRIGGDTPCTFVGTSSGLKVLRKYCDDPPGAGGPSCEPDEDITTYNLTITVQLTGAGPVITSALIGAGTDELPGDVPVGFASTLASNFKKCCKNFTETLDEPAAPWNTVGGGDIDWIMCGGNP